MENATVTDDDKYTFKVDYNPQGSWADVAHLVFID